MNGYLMYELARQRIADQHRAAERRLAARQAAAARKERASARRRHAGQETADAAVVPVVPDFADELLDAMARDAAAAPQEAGRGRQSRTRR